MRWFHCQLVLRLGRTLVDADPAPRHSWVVPSLLQQDLCCGAVSRGAREPYMLGHLQAGQGGGV